MEEGKIQLVESSKFLLAVLLITLCSTNKEVSAYGSGAPGYSCEAMIPWPCHGRSATLPLSSAFIVDIRPKIIKPNSQITVTLKANASKKFRGFLVTAFKTTGAGPRKNKLIGTFHGSLKHSRIITCIGGGKGLTQRNNKLKREITFTWSPPDSMSNSDIVVFNVTIVEHYAMYWTDSSPAELTVSCFPDLTGTETTQQPKAATVYNSIVSKKAILKEDTKCGVDYSCFHDCINGNCSFTVSWKDKGIFVAFHMKMMPFAIRDRWMAVGFSHDRKVGYDSITECVVEDNGDVKVYNSYNTGKNNHILDNKRVGLSNMSGSSNNGLLECRFDRNKISPYEPGLFDLDRDWYMMFAHGDPLTGCKSPNLFDITPYISSCLVDLQTTLTVSVHNEYCIVPTSLPGV